MLDNSNAETALGGRQKTAKFTHNRVAGDRFSQHGICFGKLGSRVVWISRKHNDWQIRAHSFEGRNEILSVGEIEIRQNQVKMREFPNSLQSVPGRLGCDHREASIG